MTLLEALWAYVTLGAMANFWAEASPLIGGLAAYDGRLLLPVVINAIAIGTWLGALLLYWLGRARGRWIRKRWPRARPVILRSVALVRRHPWRAAVAVRFAYGLRIALPLACGVGRVPLAAFAAGTAVSCIAWSASFTLLGWGLGRTTETLLGQVRRFEPLIGALVVLAMVVGYIVVRRRHVAERTARALDADP